MSEVVTETRVIEPADEEIFECLNLDSPKSFFLYAGAGSGKTGSLVQLLRRTVEKYGRHFALRSQKIAVITYTNAACDEIKGRLEYDPLIEVSTIHSFAWKLLEGYNDDIRAWLKTELEEQIIDLEQKQSRNEKTLRAKEKSIESKRKRLSELSSVRKFTYSPIGDNRGRDALNHSEVIKMTADFLATKPTLAKILVCRHPFLLIDESQDTSRRLMDAFLHVERQSRSSFCVGLFGDVMQRIYADGKEDLAAAIPQHWAKPAKLVNYRCPERVLKLINRIRVSVDDHQQVAPTNTKVGHIRLFLMPSGMSTKQATEAKVAEKMASLTADPAWKEEGGYKALILEHHMAAKRLGIEPLFTPLYSVDRLQTGLLDGTLPSLRFLGKEVLPLVKELRAGNAFGVATIMRQKSPALTRQSLVGAGANQISVLRKADEGVQAILQLWTSSDDPTILELVNVIHKYGLLEVPDALVEAMPLANVSLPEGFENMASDETLAWVDVLKGPFSQIAIYDNYINDRAQFGTHQGVKGLEFPRVMVIIDDEDRGFLFSYEKLFGVKPKSDTDLKNERDGKDTSLSRTARLFYVTCSRAKDSLAVVAYTSDPDAIRKRVVSEGWFNEDEVESIT